VVSSISGLGCRHPLIPRLPHTGSSAAGRPRAAASRVVPNRHTAPGAGVVGAGEPAPQPERPPVFGRRHLHPSDERDRRVPPQPAALFARYDRKLRARARSIVTTSDANIEDACMYAWLALLRNASIGRDARSCFCS
jgi:hypothetical protein